MAKPSGNEPTYDAFIVGGGPAGLSAALQLARSNRQVVVFDSGQGRSTFQQVTHNYLGFPGGIAAREFRDISRAQVQRYPVAFIDEGVCSVEAAGKRFRAVSDSGTVIHARCAVFATGVQDHFPEFKDWESYVGRSIFWCIVCDGYSTRGKRLVILGNDDEAAVTALQFLQFTPNVVMLTNELACEVSTALQTRLKGHGITLLRKRMAGVVGNAGVLIAVELSDGSCLPADFLFSLQGSVPNSDLPKSLGVKTSTDGFITVDADQQTNVPGVFAAGDVTRIHSHQVATAAHEGLTAASAAQHFLYEPWQRAPA